MYRRWENEILERKDKKIHFWPPAPPLDSAEPTVNRKGGETTAVTLKMVAEVIKTRMPVRPTADTTDTTGDLIDLHNPFILRHSVRDASQKLETLLKKSSQDYKRI